MEHRCIVCGDPADTIRDGRDYCARHGVEYTRQVTIVVCAVDGCGCPVAPGSRWCLHHHPHISQRAA